MAIIASMLTVGCPGPKPNPCDDVTCPEHSCCEGGVCVCEDGWSGDQCDQEDRCFTGTLDCGSYGDCVDNTCVCHDGWQGELCDEQNPCYGVECGTHGNCVNGACVCDTNYYGETCSVFFDCSDSLVCMEIDPEYSGEVIVPGSVLTGYGVGEIKVGAIDRRAFLFIRELIAREVPEPNEGRVLNQAYGMTIRCVDANLPRNEDGTWNDVPLLKEVKIHFAGHRARVLRHVPEEGGLGSFDYIDVVIEPTGSSAMVLAFSDFLLLDTNPVIAASAPADTTIREVTIDFSGTLDEGDPSAYFLSFSAEEDGTPLSLTALGSHSFTANLSGGSHTLFAMVEDPYGNVDTVELTVNVDLCSDVTCEPWQTCRELDGVCVGADPCVPNPCRTDNIDYGDCDSSTGDPVCDCYTGFAGALCDACDAGSGYEGTFPDCQLDLCFGVNCPDDGDECNGTEACDPADGQCKHFDPI
ncbi:hypothetical protein JW752_04355, partial [Candidatus Peregrinibacteria bacterium]|nr:hypothetical protein [Candidatus Peregrinibacteria bacterium]